MPNRWQAIIWTNAKVILRHIHVALVEDELTARLGPAHSCAKAPAVTITHWGRDKMAAILQTTFLEFQFIFLNENCYSLIDISLKYAPRGPISNTRVLVQVMAWLQTGGWDINKEAFSSIFLEWKLLHFIQISKNFVSSVPVENTLNQHRFW